MAGKRYNKADLIVSIAQDSGLSQAESERQLATVLGGLKALTSTMEVTDKLQLVGYMSMEVAHKEAYQAKNPQTGESVTVPASNKLKIKAGKELVDSVQR